MSTSSRGVPWDDLPSRSGFGSKVVEISPVVEPPVEELNERDLIIDLKSIAKRAAFGLVCGSLTGACFGFVDVLRDARAMSKNPKIATNRIVQYTGKFGGFFSLYHGMRRTLKLYYPQPPEMNVLTALTFSLTPLVAMPKMRPMIPYAIMLVGLDAINGMNDI